MATVYDAKTGLPVSLPPDQVQSGIASGALGFDQNSQEPIYLKSADDRTFKFTDPKAAAQAIADNPTQYRLLTQDEQMHHDVSQQEKQKGVWGDITSGAESLANQATFGALDELRNHLDSPEEVAKREFANSLHPVSRFLGGAVGAAVPFLATGGVGDALGAIGEGAAHLIAPAEAAAETSLATKALATTAKYAAQGVALTTPQAAVQAAFGDTKQARETLAWGMLGGTLGGWAGEGLSAAGRGISNLTDKVGNKLIESGLQAAPEVASQPKDELIDWLHDQGVLDKPNPTIQDVRQAVVNARQEAAKPVNSVFQGLDENVKQGMKDKDLTSFALQQQDLPVTLQKELTTPELLNDLTKGKPQLDNIIKLASELPTTKVNGRPIISFKTANDFLDKLSSDMSPVGQAAYQVSKNTIEQSAAKLAGEMGNPEIMSNLTSAFQKIEPFNRLQAMAANLEQTQASNANANLMSLLGMRRGIASQTLGMAGAGVGGLLGGWPGALAGREAGKIAGIPLDMMARSWLKDGGMVKLGTWAKKAAAMGSDVFSSAIAGESQPRLAASLAKVGQTLKYMSMRAPDLAHNAFDPIQHLGMKDEQEVADRILQLQDPATQTQFIAQMTAPFANLAPGIAMSYSKQLQDTLNYLGGAVPKQTAPSIFGKPKGDMGGSKRASLDFNDKLSVAINPNSVLNHLQDGSLSDAHMNALQTLYPAVYAKQQGEVLTYLNKHPNANFSHAQENSINKFMGIPPELDAQFLQQQYQAPNKQAANAAPGSKSGGKKAQLKGDWGQDLATKFGPKDQEPA